MGVKCDFSGYATKNNIRCSDGRTIRKNAFIDNDGMEVPLVWQHMHDDPDNVLGHALLENREDGVYAYGFFNDTEAGRTAKQLVKHGDVRSMSIYANKLKQQGGDVLHGLIREVSLVLAPANPGAYIDTVCIAHADGSYTDLEDEAVIFSGEDIKFIEEGDNGMSALKHADSNPQKPKTNEEEDADTGEKTIGEIFDELTEEQKNVVYYMIGKAVEDAKAEMVQHYDEGDDDVKFNAFENDDQNNGSVLSHDDLKEIIADAKRMGSLKDSFLAHVQNYGIENIDILFPDAKTLTSTPDFIKRNTDWVSMVLNTTTHTPFSRIKSVAADITADEARARGYAKGGLKKDEIIRLLKRVTTPTTIYKKQKLDRDDMIDITDLNVIAWLKAEMRLMLDEEIARAILIGDGRDPDSEDKINEDNVRPIWTDDDLYAHHVLLEDSLTPEDELEAIIRAMEEYKGSGAPVLYTTQGKVTDWLLLKDKNGRRLYESETQIASFLGVDKIVKVPLMKGRERTVDGAKRTLSSIIVNLKDYKVGADKGGEVSMFDDFDIDYNQHKYLIETRISGCLVLPKSAIVVETSVTAAAG